MVNQTEAAKSVNLVNSLRLIRNDLVPVCAWCKKVRDEHGHWHQIDLTRLANTGTGLTHTICDDCKQEYSVQLQPACVTVTTSGFGAP